MAVTAVETDDDAARRLAESLAVRLPGSHNVANAALAAACAGSFGVPLETCLAALKTFSLPGNRWRVVERDAVTYIADCYNANPTSMAAALETFASIPVTGRRIAVLGDMLELGAQSEALHAQIKSKAAALPLDEILYVGPSFGGGTREEARARLAGLLRPGDAVLLKASNSLHLETLLEPAG